MKVLQLPKSASDDAIMDTIEKARKMAYDCEIEHVSIQLHVSQKVVINFDGVAQGK